MRKVTAGAPALPPTASQEGVAATNRACPRLAEQLFAAPNRPPNSDVVFVTVVARGCTTPWK